MSISMLSMITAAAASQPSGTASFFVQMFPLVAIFVIFYLLLIRPQQRRMKQHQAAVAGIKKGDEVVTGGGMLGRVTKVSETEAEVEIAQGIRVRVVKSTLSQVLTKPAKPAND
jgi:preprotein translocase subunit YajC